jgi:hypothetical protein
VESCGGRIASRRAAESLTESAALRLTGRRLREDAVEELTSLAASTVGRANLWRASLAWRAKTHKMKAMTVEGSALGG